MTVLKARDRKTDMRMHRFDLLDGGIAIDENSRARGKHPARHHASKRQAATRWPILV